MKSMQAMIPALMSTLVLAALSAIPCACIDDEYHKPSDAVSAINTLNNIKEAQAFKRERKMGGSTSYVSSLSALGPDGIGLIDERTASGKKANYSFSMRTDERGWSYYFEASAVPLKAGETRYFWVSVDSPVRIEEGHPAGPSSRLYRE